MLKLVPSYCSVLSPSSVFAVPLPVIMLLSALLLIVVAVPEAATVNVPAASS